MSIVKEMSSLVQRICPSLLDILSECGMELMDRLEEATPSVLRIKEVANFWAASSKLIDKILKFDKEVIRNFIANPTRDTLYIYAYIKNLKRESTKLNDDIFNVNF